MLRVEKCALHACTKKSNGSVLCFSASRAKQSRCFSQIQFNPNHMGFVYLLFHHILWLLPKWTPNEIINHLVSLHFDFRFEHINIGSPICYRLITKPHRKFSHSIFNNNRIFGITALKIAKSIKTNDLHLFNEIACHRAWNMGFIVRRNFGSMSKHK